MWTALVFVCSMAQDPSVETCFVSTADFFSASRQECKEDIAMAYEDGAFTYPPLDEYDKEWVFTEYQCIEWNKGERT